MAKRKPNSTFSDTIHQKAINKFKDKTFGKWFVLKVLRPVEYDHRLATVICTCGKVSNVQTSTLTSGKSTGCPKCAFVTRRHGNPSTAMAIGDKINNFELIRYESDTVRCRAWFRCKCGIESLKPVSRVKSGKVKGCRKCRHFM